MMLLRPASVLAIVALSLGYSVAADVDGSEDNHRSLESKSTKSDKSSKGSKDSKSGNKRLVHFTSGDIELEPCVERREIIAEELGGDLDAPFVDVQEPYLTPDEVLALRVFADMALEESIAKGVTVDHKGRPLEEDFLACVDVKDYMSMVDIERTRKMYNDMKQFNPKYPVSRINLRRTNLAGDKHIRYHVDGPSTVMHVWLNTPDDLDGGLYLFLGRNGTTKIDNSPGAAIIHGDEIIHGVASFTGVRYTLLFVGDSTTHEDILADALGFEDNHDHVEL